MNAHHPDKLNPNHWTYRFAEAIADACNMRQDAGYDPASCTWLHPTGRFHVILDAFRDDRTMVSFRNADFTFVVYASTEDGAAPEIDMYGRVTQLDMFRILTALIKTSTENQNLRVDIKQTADRLESLSAEDGKLRAENDTLRAKLNAKGT